MEVEPYSVPKDCCSLRDATDRFVCDKSQHSAQKVCVMDTRPSECCNRRVQCPVVRPTVLCISSLQSDHEVCAKYKKSERENFASNPSMEIETLVPPPVFSPIRSTSTSSEFRDYCTLLPPSNQKALKPQLNINKLTLAVWPLSGNASLNTKFLRECPRSYSPHGTQEQNLSINPVGESGIAGVWNRKSIQFLVT